MGAKVIKRFEGEYFFLSNFYRVTIIYDSWRYPSVEHAYQASKTFHLSDKAQIAHAETPAEARRLSRFVELRDDWEEVKESIMFDLLFQKFRNLDLAKRLWDTENALLAEENLWHDNFWGNCVCQLCKDEEGKNCLGKYLMRIRRESRTYPFQVKQERRDND